MRKFVTGLMGVMLLCTFALAACGESSVAATPTDTPVPAVPTATTAPTATAGDSNVAGMIGMGLVNFTNTNATIKVGQSVTFADSADNGGAHIIVTGTHGQFAAAPGAPSAFATNEGVTFSPGVSFTYKFTTAGTYHFTCKIHPDMQATVTVKP
ncbi:MAG TPA: plastocyanin/azurin family copper-binding protein [Ktedonobacterales bacterium]|jgi:plastocyanin